MKDIKTNPKDERLKVKLIKDKPKVYAVSIDYDFHFDEFVRFLNNTKDKKFDVIVNGKLFKITSSVAKNKFAEGFKSAYDISSKTATDFGKSFKDTINKLNSENTRLKNEAKKVKEDKDNHIAKEASMNIVISSWKDRIAELEDTCQILRTTIDEMKPDAK